MVRTTRGEGALAGLVFAALFTAFLVVFAFQLDIEEIFGLSFDWGWTLLDSGHTERVALTSKIADVDTRSIFMVPGEELEVDIDFRPESGRAYVNILGYGWVKPFGELDFLYREPVIRSPFRRTVRVPARRAGVYTVDGRILEATGTFSYDWRVRNTRPTGRLVRGARLVLFSFPGLLVLLFVIVLGVTWVGSRFD